MKSWNTGPTYSRRQLIRNAALACSTTSSSGWFPALADELLGTTGRPPRSCILLWMSGGPSQLETFDPKPEHENGGPGKAIQTVVPGISISENLPEIAARMQDLAIIRSMSTKEGDHNRATYFLRTGYLPQGPIRYPAMGSFLAHELVQDNSDLPPFISINPFRAVNPDAWSPGFLGPAWSPLIVTGQSREDALAAFEVRNLKVNETIGDARLRTRLQMLGRLEDQFLQHRPDVPGQSHRQAYQSAVRMMTSAAVLAFDLSGEPAALRESYGRSAFGQGCLLARRLVESGVAFVEVSLGSPDGTGGAGWDTHSENFSSVADLCRVLDPAWSTLLTDLRERGLLESTLVLWMGEFGRTPVINPNSGRDHWPGSWSVVAGGGGIRGGQTYGATEADGVAIRDNPVTAQQLIATVCGGLGVDAATTNISNIGRPIPLADHDVQPISELLM